ncbi:MAG: transcription termination factor NusA [Anaerolineales bacterium]
MKSEVLLAFNELLEERQLPREAIIQAIEAAMVHAYRKTVNASNAQRVEAKLNLENGRITIFAEKEVVEKVEDARTEISLEDARKVKPDAQLGEMLLVESTPADFGRVAAQTARQVIQQRLRDAERNMQLEYYKGQIGEIVSGVVQAVQPQQITVGLEMKAEGILPANHKIPGERFRVHDRIRAVVIEVKETPRGPQIILSRTHRQFLKRLLENEVPEIYRGIVEIRAIAREAGQRAKVAVAATQPGIDPVGACVGIKGVRIQAIVKELHDEKIDVIQWDPDPVVYISKALSPARVLGVYLSEEGRDERIATVVVSEDQLSLAIGRDGQNARLAARLTGWRIDIKSLPEAASEALYKLQQDAVLQSMLPLAVEAMPQIEEILARKAENRPVNPEEYQLLARFVDWVERRIVTAREDAQRMKDERLQAARAEIPEVAFSLPLERLGLKEHIYTLLSESFETIGDLMLVYKTDPDRILKMPGIGPRAMENIETCLASFPFAQFVEEAPAAAEETIPAEIPAAITPEIASPVPSETMPVEVSGEAIPVTELSAVEAPAQPTVLPEDDLAKDGVRLDDLFSVELFRKRSQAFSMEEESGKGKKKAKKKYIEIEYDEDSGETIARKRHKRGDEDWEEW